MVMRSSVTDQLTLAGLCTLFGYEPDLSWSMDTFRCSETWCHKPANLGHTLYILLQTKFHPRTILVFCGCVASNSCALLPPKKCLQEKDGVVLYLRKIFGSEDISKFVRCLSRCMLHCRVPPKNLRYENKGMWKLVVAISSSGRSN